MRLETKGERTAEVRDKGGRWRNVRTAGSEYPCLTRTLEKSKHSVFSDSFHTHPAFQEMSES